MVKKTLYTLQWMEHPDLIKKMEETVQKKLGFEIKFDFELADDKNTDLFFQSYEFTNDQIEKLVDFGLLNEGIFDDLKEGEDVSVPDYLNYELNELFQFILGETFGKEAYIAGVEFNRYEEVVMLNVAIPSNSDNVYVLKRINILSNGKQEFFVNLYSSQDKVISAMKKDIESLQIEKEALISDNEWGDWDVELTDTDGNKYSLRIELLHVE